MSRHRRLSGLASVAVWLIAACGLGVPEARAQAAAPPPLENGSFVAELNGFRIHYEVHGHGPVLMTLPNSWGLSLQGLRALYRPLEERLTLVYFDPRGMGGSAPVREDADMGMEAVREDFEALRSHLGLGQVNAIGWSNGAMNLIQLAAEHPESLATAIFVHGAASFTAEDGKEFVQAHPQLVERNREFRKRVADPALGPDEQTRLLRELWLGELFPASFADKGRASQLLEQTFRDAAFSWRHADYTGRQYPVFDMRDELPGIRVRSLVIAGTADTLPPAKAEELSSGLPNATLVVFEQSGHFSQIEQPEAFQKAVLEFLGVR